MQDALSSEPGNAIRTRMKGLTRNLGAAVRGDPERAACTAMIVIDLAEGLASVLPDHHANERKKIVEERRFRPPSLPRLLPNISGT